MDWSHDALPAPEQAVFRRLSVFAGSFTLAAAEGVAGGGEVDGADVVDLLGSLVDRSLVVAQDDGRYRLLETLRAYGAERLEESGEEDVVRQHHFEWFGAAASTHDRPYAEHTVAFLDSLEAEHDELRAALRWAIDSGRVESAADLAANLAQFWRVRGYMRQGRRWFEEILAGGVAGPRRARALRQVTRFQVAEVDLGQDATRVEEALTLARQAGDHGEVVACLGTLAYLAAERGDLEGGEQRLAEAKAEYDGHPLPDHHLYELLTLRGFLAGRSGDPRAPELFGEALEVARRVGAELMVLNATGRMAQSSEGSGHVDRAKVLYQETLDRANRARFSFWRVTAQGALGRLAQFDGDLYEAASLYANAVLELSRNRDRSQAWFWLFHVASLALDARQPEAAARILGMESAVAGGRRHTGLFKVRYDQTVDRTKAALGPGFDSAHHAGAALPADDAFAEVLAWLRALASEEPHRDAESR